MDGEGSRKGECVQIIFSAELMFCQRACRKKKTREALFLRSPAAYFGYAAAETCAFCSGPRLDGAETGAAHCSTISAKRNCEFNTI